jgi:alanine racemase
MSHLACAERQDHAMNRVQLARFTAARSRLPAAPASLANSSGIFLSPDFHFDLARPGAALYGIAPVAGEANPMRPVVRLRGRIIQVRDVPAGAQVGYGASWTATRPSRIATVSVGYADGYLRSLSHRATAHVDGTAVPQVGVVSMDSVTFDVTDAPAAVAGAFVDLIGPDNPVDAVAAAAGTIGYEILTSLGRRYARRYAGARTERLSA